MIKTTQNVNIEFHDLKIGTADNKNALETPFFVILSPQKGMEGFVIDI